MEESTNVAQDNTESTETTEQITETTATETIETTTEQADESKAPVVPETYADFELPEGFEMDAAALEEFMPLAKSLGMTQEAAQQAIGLHTKAISSIMARIEEQRTEAYANVMKDIKADKSLGGKAYEANIGKINSVLTNFGGEGVADTFHAAVAQIAAHDPAQAKAMYSTLHAIAKAASIDNSLVLGMPRRVNDNDPYPGLPNKN